MTAKRSSQITAMTGGLLVIALIAYFSGHHNLKNIVLVTASVIAGIPIALKALQALRMKAFSIQLLVTIAVIGALIIGEYVEAAAVSFLFLFGAYLEARTLEKTRSSLKELTEMAPLEATVVRNDQHVVVSVDNINVGDRVIVRSGEKVAVDGRIISGQASFNEATITGESVPAAKSMDDQVYSGTIVDHGFIEMVAERVGDDTTFAKIIELVEEAQEAKARTEKFLDRFANIYTPAIVILSVVVYLFTRNIHLTLTFLVVACPGALVISAPVSFVAGIGNGAKNGVLVKGGDIMERLAKVNVAVFDKTGTLTRGKPEVTNIHTYGMKSNDLLRLVAEAEMISEHHLGQTIVKEAKNRELSLINQAEHAEVIKGHGIRATIEGSSLVIGNRGLMKTNNIDISSEVERDVTKQEKAGNTAIIAAVNGTIAGIISIADQVRSDAYAALSQLRAEGIQKIIMLTGDNRYTAELVGSQLELDEVHAELLPEDKVRIVQQLKDAGYRVAMAGDGINDAPAIATADIGLAMGEGGTDISMETADIVLMADRLSQFAHAYALSKATMSNLIQNTFFAVGTVVLLLLGVLFGKIFLASGMFIHELSVLLVIMNAIRLVKFKRRKGTRKKELEPTLQ